MRIFFFGDSICFGQHVSPHLTWVNRICRHLSDAASRELLIANTSISGNTTRMALERMPFDVQAHGVDILLVQFGMNDCNYWKTDNGLPRVSSAAFKANLAEIVARGRHFGAKRIFLNTNHPTPLTDRFEYASIDYQSSNERYNEIIRSVSDETGTVLIDVESAWRDKIGQGVSLENLLLPDKIHLSLAGHALYTEIVLPYLTEAVLQ